LAVWPASIVDDSVGDVSVTVAKSLVGREGELPIIAMTTSDTTKAAPPNIAIGTQGHARTGSETTGGGGGIGWEVSNNPFTRLATIHFSADPFLT